MCVACVKYLYSLLTTVVCLAAVEGALVGVEWDPPWVRGVLESPAALPLLMHDLQPFLHAAEVHLPLSCHCDH